MLCALPFALSLGLCVDETISGHSDTTITWQLTELDGQPFTGEAAIAFPAKGEVIGNGPCNTFSATQALPYPEIGIGRITSTRMACPDIAEETAYFAALQNMTTAEVGDAVLILSAADGRRMVFTAD